MTPCRQDPGYLAEQYEALRQEAIETLYDGRRGHGLALFLTRGMTAWIEALNALAPRTAVPCPQGATAGYIPSSARSDLTSLLADMVLACSSQGAP